MRPQPLMATFTGAMGSDAERALGVAKILRIYRGIGRITQDLYNT
jgi:hypothetical protein